MAQNYKVFIKNTLLIFTDISFLDENATIYYDYELKSFEDDIFPFIEKNTSQLIIICQKEALRSVIDRLFIHFKSIQAAGGWVVKGDKVLLIRRNGFWDLPKGKVEKKESIEHAAIREVEEECGISGMQLKQKLIETYHCYEMKGRWYFKTNHWFLMHYEGNETLVPQLEEGISEVKWFHYKDVPAIYPETFSSLLDLMEVGLKIFL